MSGELNIGAKVYIACESDGVTPDPQNVNLDESAFNALNWVQIPNVGNFGQTGVNQNMTGYESWDNPLTVQQKGSATGEQPELRFLDEPSDGATAVKTAAAVTNSNNYALRVLYASGDEEFNRGVIGSLRRTKGANQDFREIVVTCALNQEPVPVTAP